MFINAQPRFVSNGLETFVPKYRTALQQRLVEMTNNDINAWCVIRPRDSSATGTWDQQLDDFNNENFQVQSLYSGYFPNIHSQGQQVAVSKPILYSNLQQGYCQPQRRPPISQQAYQSQQTNMNFSQRSNPMLGADYSQMSRGSFAEFSTMQNAPKDFNYQPSMASAMNPFITCDSSDMIDSPYLEDGSILDAGLNVEKTSPSTVYSGYSTSSNSTDPGILGLFNMVNSQASMNSVWWPENQRLAGAETHNILPSNDGLPKYQSQQQPSQGSFSNPWTVSSSSTSKWATHAVEPSTISPKALSLNVSSLPLSLSTSSQGSLAISDSSTTGSNEDDQSDISGPEILAVVETQASAQRPLQMLPDSGSASRPLVPVIPNNDFAPTKTTTSKGSAKLTTKPASQLQRKNTSTSSGTKTSNASPHKSEMPSRTVHKRLEPKPSNTTQSSSGKQPQPSATTQATHQRDAKDDFLVRCKLAGMSYKEIRRKGKFTEAESTLRGRFRTLTKAKAARVRKPEWNDNDIRLLKKAVRKLTPVVDPFKKAKVPWKQVAEYIADNGGSYHFGNSTCRKRWDELQAES